MTNMMKEKNASSQIKTLENNCIFTWLMNDDKVHLNAFQVVTLPDKNPNFYC